MKLIIENRYGNEIETIETQTTEVNRDRMFEIMGIVWKELDLGKDDKILCEELFLDNGEIIRNCHKNEIEYFETNEAFYVKGGNIHRYSKAILRDNLNSVIWAQRPIFKVLYGGNANRKINSLIHKNEVLTAFCKASFISEYKPAEFWMYRGDFIEAIERNSDLVFEFDKTKRSFIKDDWTFTIESNWYIPLDKLAEYAKRTEVNEIRNDFERHGTDAFIEWPALNADEIVFEVV